MARRQICSMRFLLCTALLGALLLSQGVYAEDEDMIENDNDVGDDDDGLMMPGTAGAAMSTGVTPAAATSMSCYKTMSGGKVASITEFQDDREAINCVSYQFKCTPDELDEMDPGCTQAEVAAGTWKWRYHAKDASDCAEMKMNTLRYRSVSCCTTPNCNKPDALVDSTAVVEPAAAAAATTAAATTPAGAPGSLSCYKTIQGNTVAVVSEFDDDREGILCSSYEYKCSLEDAADHDDGCTQADVGTWKWMYDTSDPTDCAYKKANTFEYRNVDCCNTPNCNKPNAAVDTKSVVSDAGAAAAAVASGAAGAAATTAAAAPAGFSCYKSIRDTVSAVPVRDNDREPKVCAAYEFKCTADDTDDNNPGCTAAEAAAGTWKWKYDWKDAGDCAEKELKTMKYRNVKCCSTPNCNIPDPKLDSKAKVVAAAPGSTVTESGPGAVPAGTAGPLAGPASAQGTLNDPSASNLTSKATSAAGAMTAGSTVLVMLSAAAVVVGFML